MPVRLENLTSRPVLLVLASGDTLRISPREVSETVDDVEVAENRAVDKLVTRGVIAVRQRPDDTQRRRASTRRRPKQGARGTAEAPSV
ncbi:MAG TPA: hypothetical protein VHF89_11915 [Solirubrobacteraceae bacterium]|nr:hypothetical protein [Solirubrobacteraceae bacterium]